MAKQPSIWEMIIGAKDETGDVFDRVSSKMLKQQRSAAQGRTSFVGYTGATTVDAVALQRSVGALNSLISARTRCNLDQVKQKQFSAELAARTAKEAKATQPNTKGGRADTVQFVADAKLRAQAAKDAQKELEGGLTGTDQVILKLQDDFLKMNTAAVSSSMLEEMTARIDKVRKSVKEGTQVTSLSAVAEEKASQQLARGTKVLRAVASETAKKTLVGRNDIQVMKDEAKANSFMQAHSKAT